MKIIVTYEESVAYCCRDFVVNGRKGPLGSPLL